MISDETYKKVIQKLSQILTVKLEASYLLKAVTVTEPAVINHV